jgi:ketosteroid isomerase-like protein
MSLLSLAVLSLAIGGTKTDARERAAVREADARRCAALAARDLPGFLSLLADDVAVFADAHPRIVGKAAAQTLLAPFFDPKGPAWSCVPSTAETAASGDVAYTTGTYLVKGMGAERSATQGHGKYVTVWRKSGGRWRIVVDIGNSAPPAERDFGPPPPP